jgi:Tol biopolymer transport system component
MDLSPDGRTLLFARWGADEADLYTVELDRENAEPQLLVGGPGEQLGGRFSPDGRWVAFTSEETGSFEIFVVPATGGDDRWQVSHDSGIKPQWFADGRKLAYRVGRRLFVSEIDPDGDTFRAGTPRPVFDDLRRAGATDNTVLDPDGQSIVYTRFSDRIGPPERISVYLNWVDEVARSVP